MKEGQSLANTSPGTCLRASFYARAPLAAPFTPYSIRSLTLYSLYIIFNVVVSLLDGFVRSLVESKIRGFLEGVDGLARPSQQLDCVEDKVAVGVGIAAAEVSLNK